MLRRRDQNTSLSHTPLRLKFTSFPRICFPLMLMYMCHLMLNHVLTCELLPCWAQVSGVTKSGASIVVDSGSNYNYHDNHQSKIDF